MNGLVDLTTAQRDNITYLKDSYTSNPFKIANIREDKSQSCLDLMLMSSSPGMLSSDDYRLKIVVAERCALSLKTQSYQRLLSMKKRANLKMKVSLQKKAFFEFVPHPTVPHKGSNLSAENEIYLQENAQVIWGDLISCGRKLNGEQFEYACLKNQTTFYYKDRPVIVEKLLLEPLERNLSAVGQLEGYSHLACLYFVGNNLDAQVIKQNVDHFLNENNIEEAAASLTPFNGVVVKFLSSQSESLMETIRLLVLRIREQFYRI